MIRCWTPEICLHDGFSPVLSVDSQSGSGRFVTGGADHHLRVWQLCPEERGDDGCPRIRFLSNLSFHSQSVNVVRWSPDGQRIASGSDDNSVALWRLQGDKDDDLKPPQHTAAAAAVSEEEAKVGEAPPVSEGTGNAEAKMEEVKEEVKEEAELAVAAAAAGDSELPSPRAATATAAALPSAVAVPSPPSCAASPLEQRQKQEEQDDDVIICSPASPARVKTAADVGLCASLTLTPSSSSSHSSASPAPSPLPFGSDPSSELDFLALNSETYVRCHQLRGHLSEVYSLCWSPCSRLLLSGGIDGQVRWWDAGEGKPIGWVEDHHGYVQGACWDPLGAVVVTESSDRSVRLYRVGGGRRAGGGGKGGKVKGGLHCRLIATLAKRAKKESRQAEEEVVIVDKPEERPSSELSPPPSLPVASVPDAASALSTSSPPAAVVASDAVPSSSSSSSSSSSAAPIATVPLFMDETLPSFFRRPCWSPDGLFLLLPSGQYQEDGKSLCCSWLYHRDDFSQPVACIPHPEPSVACAFSPRPYRPPATSSPAAASSGYSSSSSSSPSSSLSSASSPACSLPYSYLFFIVTVKSLLLYSTHSVCPIASVSNLHLSSLTDIAWCRSAAAQQQEDGSVRAVEHVLVSSSDGFLSVLELDALAERLTEEEERRWREDIEQRRQAISKAIAAETAGEAKPVKTGKRKRKTQPVSSLSLTQPLLTDADGKAEAAPDGSIRDGKDEKQKAGEEKAKAQPVSKAFVVTEQMKSRLSELQAAGELKVESVKALLGVGRNRAMKAIRQWKESSGMQVKKRKTQTQHTTAAVSAAAGADGDDKKQVMQQTAAASSTDMGGGEDKVEEKAKAPEVSSSSSSSKEERQRRRKERKQQPIAQAEAKRGMKTLDSFFTKTTAQQPSMASAAATSTDGAGAGDSSGDRAAVPAVPADASGGEPLTVKRRIAPILISAGNSSVAAAAPDAVDLTAAEPAQPTTSKKDAAAGKKSSRKKRKRQTKKPAVSSKKQKAEAAAVAAASSAASGPPTAALLPSSSSLPAVASIDLTDESPPAVIPPVAAAAAPAPAPRSASPVAVSRTGSGSRRIQIAPAPLPTVSGPEKQSQAQEAAVLAAAPAAAATKASAAAIAFFAPNKRPRRTIVPVQIVDGASSTAAAGQQQQQGQEAQDARVDEAVQSASSSAAEVSVL